MQIVVKVFADHARIVGVPHITVDLHEAPTIQSLRKAIATQYPPLNDTLSACRFAINHDFADDTTSIQPNDEVALIGPVSGG